MRRAAVAKWRSALSAHPPAQRGPSVLEQWMLQHSRPLKAMDGISDRNWRRSFSRRVQSFQRATRARTAPTRPGFPSPHLEHRLQLTAYAPPVTLLRLYGLYKRRSPVVLPFAASQRDRQQVSTLPLHSYSCWSRSSQTKELCRRPTPTAPNKSRRRLRARMHLGPRVRPRRVLACAITASRELTVSCAAQHTA